MDPKPVRKERVLVAGCGSIGKRHIRNLQELGVEEVMAYDPEPIQMEKVRAENGFKIVPDLQAGLRTLFPDQLPVFN